jgi:iron complex transport system substrate-binding protein
VRIVSLLPSATEIVYALGAEDDLVGVTHECNWPPAARAKPQVSRSLLPPDATPAEIDALVSAGPATTTLDEDVLARLAPDVILTQDLCAVCAVPAGDVEAALSTIGCRSDVISLDPGSLDDVLDGIGRVGAALGRDAEAEAVVAALRGRLDQVGAAVAGRTRRRVFVLEWGDPPFNGGHWIPEMVERAGGLPVLAEPGRDSVRVRWEDVAAARPEVVVFTPCGYDLEGAVEQGVALLAQPALQGVELWAVDADGCFVRPGPRLVDGVEILAALLHADVAGPVPADGARRLG